MEKLNTKQLVELFRRTNPEEMPVITIIDCVWEEQYLENGMKAHLVNVTIDEVYEGETIYKLKFEFEEFQGFNKKLEQADYYDKDGNPTLTASAAGYYPKDHTEEIYSGENNTTEYFSIDEGERFCKLDAEVHEFIIGMLKGRQFESKDEKTLELTIRALEQLGYEGNDE